jgi:hypothetical protein
MLRLAAALILFCLSLPFAARGDTLPPPKLDWRSSYAGIDEGDKAKKPKDCCDFLCDIIIVNTTGVRLKGMARATLVGVPGYIVELDGVCHANGIVTVHPCRHSWYLWFDKIKIGIWDGEQTANLEFDFYGCCCKRRLIALYENGKLRLVEK